MTDTGLRGTLATQDIAEGEPIVLLPHNLTIDIADYTYPGAVRAPTAACTTFMQPLVLGLP